MDASSPVTVALPTLGCKANRYDSDTLARALIACGYVIVPASSPADVYIVNTCTVTGEADAKSRKLLRKALRVGEEALVIVTGCYASLEAAQLAAIAGVDAVVPLDQQHCIPELVMRLRPPRQAAAPVALRSLSASADRTRATVKIQDGCNLRCTFCAVTLARGPVRSRPLPEVLTELRALAERGIPEIVLTGIRLDAYGLDLPATRLTDVLDATRGLPVARLRLSSLEPIGITETLIARMAAHPTLCRHFHICLQSGDNDVLRAMRRGYTAERYLRIIDRLRAAMPDATFTTDVIVGFPGEDDAAFARTCALVETVGFIKLHVFPFSPRPHTVAATLTPRVPDPVKEARKHSLFALERRLFAAYAATLIGQTVPVLVEHGSGLTSGYVRVHAPFPRNSVGTVLPIRITGSSAEGLTGEV